MKRPGLFVNLYQIDPSQIKEGYGTMAYFAHEIGHVLDTLNGIFHTRAQYGKNGYEVVADDYATICVWYATKSFQKMRWNTQKSLEKLRRTTKKSLEKMHQSAGKSLEKCIFVAG